ncbi:ImmA/IrrE family metallo-endopeptidase [Albimonas pacifica]|uniref:IrrE N-terminal-like domain-containing protein n=1 Tax=Albimonas pacifica TaxID=1114924 RepID=A0A1I3FG55_9RHOB|nr:ImmA/IrrE family metallo-endopeptidase [Albimonas pacifica]SFI10176.1 protein of unknown function [Albimonas pacifica]
MRRNTKIPLKRVERIFNEALRIRRQFASDSEPFDSIGYIEERLPFAGIYSFDFMVEEKVYSGNVQVPAYVNIRDKIFMRIDQRTYDDATDMHPKAREIVAHEIGHIVLHVLVAKRMEIRNFHKGVPVTDAHYKTTEVQEFEADLFAAALLIPWPAVAEETTAWDLKLRYKVKSDVAGLIIYYSDWIRRSKKKG